MNQTFIKSTLILSIATLISKILGSIFRIPLQNIAGDEVLGIFSLVYPVYMVALILSVAGIPIAISKLISEARVHNDHERIQHIRKTASILALLFGLLSFSLIFGFSEQIAHVLGGQSTRLALIVVATTLLIAPYMAVYRGYFQGFENMVPTAMSQVIEQFVRVGLILIFAFLLVRLNYSDEMVAGGVMVGSSIGALASLIYLRTLYVKSATKQATSPRLTWKQFTDMSKTILYISIPISIGAITMALINFVDSITIPMSLIKANETDHSIHYLYGIYGRGLSLVQIATVFSSSLVLPLIPHITKMLAENNVQKAREITDRTHFLAHLISWPAAFGLFALTLPLNVALFTNLAGSDVLAIIGLSSVFTSLSILGTGILQGMNLAKHAAYIIIGAVIAKVATNIMFIQSYGLIGAAYSTLVIYVLIFVTNSYMILKHVRFTFWSKKHTMIVLSATIMAIVIGLPTMYFQIEAWSRKIALAYSLVAIIVGGGLYFILLFVMNVLKKEDMEKISFINKWLPKKKRSKESQNIEKKRGGEGTMMTKKPLWILLIVSLLLSLPGIAQRMNVEWKNNVYEFIIPYEEVASLVATDTLQTADVLERLKAAGLQSVSLEPESLESLKQRGDIITFTPDRMREIALLSQQIDPFMMDEHQGVYVYILNDTPTTEMMTDVFASSEIKTVTFNGKEMIFIPGKSKEIMGTSLGFSDEVIRAIHAADLAFVPRMPSVSDDEEETLFEELLTLSHDTSHRLLLSGKDVFGFPDTNKVKSFGQRLHDANYQLYQIEMFDQRGFTPLAYTMGMQIIRLHSLDLSTIDEPQVAIDRAVRAVKERNIRSLFLRLNKGEPEEVLKETEQFMIDVQQQMPRQFQLGTVQPIENYTVPTWSYLFAFVSAILFLMLATNQVFQNKWLTLLVAIGLTVISIGYALLKMSLLLKGLALLVAITTPIFALLPLKQTDSFRAMLRAYGRAAGISFIGVIIITALLNDNAFLVKVDAFKGVKLLYIAPILFMCLYALLGNIKKLLAQPIRYWQAAVGLVIAVVVIYYISRTGNAGTASHLELSMRQWLEQVLYARPRTKEFLIGFPFFVLTLYVYPKYPLLGKVLLIPSVVGFLSLVNTFTHLHIPLYVSLIRSVLGLGLGLLVGFIFIFIFKKIVLLYDQRLKPRWFS